MAMEFPPSVERWRTLVAKYFPPELVDKALYVIQHESNEGDSSAVGDNGVAIGLFQIQSSERFPGRPTKDQLLDPEFNIKYAAQNLGAASGKWTDWGEGATYQGSKFGALGNNPFPPGGSSMATGDPTYAQIQARIQALMASPPSVEDFEAYSFWLEELNTMAGLARSLKPETASGEDPATAAAAAEFNRKIAAVNASLGFDNTNLSRAIADIDRFLSGKEDSRARATLKQAQTDAVTRYGTAPGKNTFSANDLGAAFGVYADIFGVDRNSQDFAKYSGTQYLDVEGDLARNDARIGATGEMPKIPPLTTQTGTIPVPSAPAASATALPGQGTAVGVKPPPTQSVIPGLQDVGLVGPNGGSPAPAPPFGTAPPPPPEQGGGGGGSSWGDPAEPDPHIPWWKRALGVT